MSTRTLVLLRHAKAEPGGELPDIDRQLTATGRANADAAGAWLADQRLHPQLVLCSPAVRTRQTWHGVAVALAQAAPDGGGPEVHYEPGLYHGGRTEVIDLLRAVPDTVRTVLIIGHNPTMSDVSVLLRPYEEMGLAEALRTSGLAVHRAEGPWSGTEPGAMSRVTTHTARG
ncbi:histidine phosphatase family protein [Actinoplanes sp. N902-109]|uniref:SixA phosphatase family protein n=1 Tax=Actinoplanes sp. (strain N902-109) TaxID=649831 RepID=UPI000329353A|nr:histidine phosphatase family protein [Actinoplanes sp. N902-109]AGL13593.1 phosphohistidine phosphatase sixA [Actinoplanes sp. N902-109]